MLNLILILIASAVMYLVPGYLAMYIFDIKGIDQFKRFFIALVTSLVLLPTAFTLVGNIHSFIPGLVPWLILNLILGGIGFVLKMRKARLPLVLNPAEGVTRGIILKEKFIVGLFLLMFAALVNLPRILMFIHGDQVLQVGPWDESWHLEELVSVARTGIPPQHFMFPSLKLAYYYGSWIYPATIGNLPGLSVSLSRAMAIHVFVQIFAFLGLVVILLQMNFSRVWSRILGILLVTMMGGLDLYARLPGIGTIDWWSDKQGWFTGRVIIDQFATLYTWVPQHLAGGMAFLLIILIWKNIKASMLVKTILGTLCLTFSFLTSAFVFLASSLAVGIGFLVEWKMLWKSRSKVVVCLLVAGLIFLGVNWQSFLMYSQHGSSFGWAEWRIPLVERFRGDSQINALLDRFLTFLTLPLTGGFILFIDLGLAYILYVIWWGERLFSGRRVFETPVDYLVGLFPPLSFVLVFLIQDMGGGGNFSMRGFMPAQILIVFGAVYVVEHFLSVSQSLGWKRFIPVYCAFCLVAAQTVSAYAEVRSTSADVVKLALRDQCGWKTMFWSRADFQKTCQPHDSTFYIYWLNQNTPTNAIVLERDISGKDSMKWRWLERNRFLLPEEAKKIYIFLNDWGDLMPSQWDAYVKNMSGINDVLKAYQGVDFRTKNQQPVYLVDSIDSQKPTQSGELVFQDDFVKIYSLGVNPK
jgi:hypothetical protein